MNNQWIKSNVCTVLGSHYLFFVLNFSIFNGEFVKRCYPAGLKRINGGNRNKEAKIEHACLPEH